MRTQFFFWRRFGVFLLAETIEYVDYAGGTLWRLGYTPSGKWYVRGWR